MAIDASRLETESMSLSTSVGERVHELRTGIVQLAEDIQSVSRRLHPSVLDDLGLVDAIDSECVRFAEREGIEVQFVPSEIPGTLPNNVSLGLYRVTQESLRNIGKHSKAKTAEVFLAVEDRTVKLSIRDSGIGFVPSQVRKKGGLGLASMEERMRLVQGRLSVTSQEGEGTRIDAEAPLGD